MLDLPARLSVLKASGKRIDHRVVIRVDGIEDHFRQRFLPFQIAHDARELLPAQAVAHRVAAGAHTDGFT